MAKKGFKAENPNKRIAERTATEETKTPEPSKETEKAAVEDTALPKKEPGKRGRPKVSNKKETIYLNNESWSLQDIIRISKRKLQEFFAISHRCLYWVHKKAVVIYYFKSDILTFL